MLTRIARITNWIAFGTLVVILLIVTAVVGGLAWLRTSWGGDFVRDQIEVQLEKLVDGEVTVGGVSGDIVSGIVLEDFSMTGTNGVTLIDAGRIAVEYQLAPLFDRRISLATVRLEDAQIRIVRDDEGRWNFATLFKPRPPRPPDAPPGWGSYIDIRRLEFRDSDVEFDLGDREWPVLDWSENRFNDLDGRLHLKIVGRDRSEPQRYFEFHDLSFETTAPALDMQALNGTAIWDDEGVRLESIEIETAGSEIVADGSLALGEGSAFDIEFDAPRVDLAEARRFVDAVRIEGVASAEGSVTGPAGNPTIEIDAAHVDTGSTVADINGSLRDVADLRFDLDIDLDRLAPQDIRPYWNDYPFDPALAGRVRLQGPPRAMNVRADLSSSAGAFSVDGEIGIGRGPLRYNVSVTSESLDVGTLIGRPSIEIVLTGGYVLDGRGTGEDTLDALFTGSLTDSRLYRWRLDSVDTTGRLIGRIYEADTLSATMPNSAIEGSGRFGLAGDGILAASVEVVSSRLEEIWPGLPEIAGEATATASIEGTYQQFDATGEVVAEGLALGAVEANRFEGEVALEDVGGAFTMTADGTLTAVRFPGVAAETGDVRIRYAEDTMEIAGELRYLDEATVTRFAGATAFDPVGARFTLNEFAHSSPEGDWVMSSGGALTVGGGVVRFDDFVVASGEQRVSADGVMALDEGASDLSIDVDNLDLIELARLSGNPIGDWEGDLSLDATLGGTRRDPVMRVTGSVTEGRIRNVRFYGIEGKIDYAERRAEVDLAVTTPDEGHDVLMTGTVPVDLALAGGVDRLPDRPIDLDVRGRNTDLSLLAAFVPGLSEMEGPVDLRVDITGRTDAPRFEGLATVNGGRFRVDATGATYSGIEGRVSFDNDEVRFDRLRGTDGSGGTFEVFGSVAMRDLQFGDLDFAIEVNDLEAVDQQQQEVNVSGTIEIAGTTESPSITGTLRVDEAIYRLPERSDKQVIDLDDATLYVEIPGEERLVRERSPSLWTRTRLDLEVRVRDEAILTSSNARAEIEGDLSLFKVAGTDVPTFSGTLSVRRGYYREFGQQFTIQEGEIFFYGTPEINPGLHIIATRSIPNVQGYGDVEIRIIVGGRLRNLTVDLESTPDFDKSEIISIALFGSPTTSNASQQSQLDSAVRGLATGYASSLLRGALGSELGLDVLEVAERTEAGGDTATLFRVGKFITPKVYVTAEQEVGGDEDRQAVGLRYQVSRVFTLQATAGNVQSGLDLFWEFAY